VSTTPSQPLCAGPSGPARQRHATVTITDTFLNTSGFNGIDEVGELCAFDKRRVLRQVVFGAVLIVYVVLVMLTVSAVREVPLDQLPDVA